MMALVRFGLMHILWTLAFGLMLVRTAWRDRPDLAFLTGWSILFGMAALGVTGYHLLVAERRHLEIVAEASARAAVDMTNGPRSVE